MIVGCYTLDLYCEEDGHPHEYNEFPHQYIHEFGSTCRRMARKDGWILDRQNCKAICPKCNPRRDTVNEYPS